MALVINLSLVFKINAQPNLVPNNSFEDYFQLNVNSYNLQDFIYYWSFGRGYFNVNRTGDFSIPANIMGRQYPHTGNAYCGIYTYLKNSYPIRQYIRTKLLQTLQINKKYKVSFYVSLSDTMHAFNNSIGGYFGIDSSYVINNYVFDVIPQIQNNVQNDLSSKTSWTLVCDTFVANGTERWITIGNFYNDSLSSITPLDSVCSMPNGFNCGAYYYIDDVSVELVDETGLSPTNLPKGEAFRLVPNPATSVVYIDGKQSFTGIEIFNAQGCLVEKISTKPIVNYQLLIANYNKGIYILKISDKNGTQCLRLLVE